MIDFKNVIRLQIAHHFLSIWIELFTWKIYQILLQSNLIWVEAADQGNFWQSYFFVSGNGFVGTKCRFIAK